MRRASTRKADVSRSTFETEANNALLLMFSQLFRFKNLGRVRSSNCHNFATIQTFRQFNRYLQVTDIQAGFLRPFKQVFRLLKQFRTLQNSQNSQTIKILPRNSGRCNGTCQCLHVRVCEISAPGVARTQWNIIMPFSSQKTVSIYNKSEIHLHQWFPNF